MAFEIRCTACGEAIRVATFFPGKRVRCPNDACGEHHTLPEEHPAPEPLPPPLFPVATAAPPLAGEYLPPIVPDSRGTLAAAAADAVKPGPRAGAATTASTTQVAPAASAAPVSERTAPTPTPPEPARARRVAPVRVERTAGRSALWPCINLMCVLALVGTVAYFVGQQSAFDDDFEDPLDHFEPRETQSQRELAAPARPSEDRQQAKLPSAERPVVQSPATEPISRTVPEPAAAVAAANVALPAPVHPVQPVVREEQAPLKLTDLAKRAAASVVQVNVRRGQDEWLGSGFVVGDGRIVVTNYHVIEGVTEAFVTRADRRNLPVEGFLAIAPERDLAVLRIISAEPLPALPLCAVAPDQGQEVATFGSPLGLANTITNGIISSLRTAAELSDLFNTPRAYPPEMEWVQTSAPISKGNSGGPLLNMRGEVVGINTLSLSNVGGESLFFAVSAQELRRLLEHATETHPFSDLPVTKPVSVAAAPPSAAAVPPSPVDPQDLPEARAAMKLEVLMGIYRRRTQLLREKESIEAEAADLNSDLKDVNIQLAPIVREGRQIEQQVANIQQQLQNATDEGLRTRLDNQRELLAIRYEGLQTRANRFANEAQRINGKLQDLGQRATKLQEQADKLRFEWLQVTDPFGKWSRGEHEQALKTLTEWVALDSECAFAYAARGFSYYGLGQYRDSLADFERALKFDRTLNVGLAGRAMALHKLDEKGKSRLEFKKALSVDSKTTFTIFCQAQIFAEDRDWKKAIAYFRKAVETDDALSQNHLARVLAACPEEKYRKGEEAVKLAENACKLSNFKVWMYVDTLAAAYAETGDFVRAYEMENRAAELAPADAKAECLERRQQYSEHRPLRLP